MESQEKPRRRDDVVLQDLDEEGMLYDPVQDVVVRLNRSSMRIWELCDGSMDVTEISAAVARSFAGADAATVEADVRAAIEAFAGAGLLVHPARAA